MLTFCLEVSVLCRVVGCMHVDYLPRVLFISAKCSIEMKKRRARLVLEKAGHQSLGVPA